MTRYKSTSLSLILVMVVIVVQFHGKLLESSTASALADIGQSKATPGDEAECSGDGLDHRVSSEVADEGPKMFHMWTAQILRDDHNAALSVVPAMLFSPAAFQIAFAQTVNLPVDEHGNTLLHVASKSGDVFSAWQLLEIGANPQIVNKFQKRPLDVVYTGNAQIAESLSAGFSLDRNAIVETLCRRLDLTHSAETLSPPSRRSSASSTPVAVTIGGIGREPAPRT